MYKNVIFHYSLKRKNYIFISNYGDLHQTLFIFSMEVVPLQHVTVYLSNYQSYMVFLTFWAFTGIINTSPLGVMGPIVSSCRVVYCPVVGSFPTLHDWSYPFSFLESSCSMVTIRSNFYLVLMFIFPSPKSSCGAAFSYPVSCWTIVFVTE